MLIVFIAFFAFSQGAVIWVYLAEIFPTAVRSRGQALGSATHWGMNTIIGQAFPMVAAHTQALPFAFFALCMVLQFFVVLVMFPETRGVELEKMDERPGNLHPKRGIVNSFTRRSSASLVGAGSSLPALRRRCREGCGDQPKTAPALQPPLLLTDWAWLARYREENAKLLASGAKVDVVFLGDSITEGWARTDAAFFSNGNRRSRHQRADDAADAGAHARGRHRAETACRAHHGGHERHRRQYRADEPRRHAEQHHGDVRDREGARDPRRAGCGAAGVEILVEAGSETARVRRSR